MNVENKNKNNKIIVIIPFQFFFFFFINEILKNIYNKFFTNNI